VAKGGGCGGEPKRALVVALEAGRPCPDEGGKNGQYMEEETSKFLAENEGEIHLPTPKGVRRKDTSGKKRQSGGVPS